MTQHSDDYVTLRQVIPKQGGRYYCPGGMLYDDACGAALQPDGSCPRCGRSFPGASLSGSSKAVES